MEDHMDSQIERDAQTVAQFCASNEISRAMLYKLWKEKLGPRFFRVGRKVLISRESAKEWRERMERQTALETAQQN
jgi:hypothetical protein